MDSTRCGHLHGSYETWCHVGYVNDKDMELLNLVLANFKPIASLVSAGHMYGNSLSMLDGGTALGFSIVCTLVV